MAREGDPLQSTSVRTVGSGTPVSERDEGGVSVLPEGRVLVVGALPSRNRMVTGKKAAPGVSGVKREGKKRGE